MKNISNAHYSQKFFNVALALITFLMHLVILRIKLKITEPQKISILKRLIFVTLLLIGIIALLKNKHWISIFNQVQTFFYSHQQH